ncbi:MAG: RNA-binding cell elongation regulator Jag/EloR [Acidimicrobiales bacterium]
MVDVEWVETTAKTIEEAKEAALDQLGVDHHDAEFEILEEPRPGLFGRLRGQARVRARVRPTQPRPKAERRDRRRRRGEGRREERVPAASATVTESSVATAAEVGTKPGRRRRRQSGQQPRGTGSTGETATTVEGSTMVAEVSMEGQAEIVHEFLDGLLEVFALTATIEERQVDDETIEVQVTGPDLGLLIGPKGQTLQSVQELARTVVQRQAPGGHEGRVRIDVGGYRQRRREALERFTRQVAADVIASGKQKALEPMNASDRKVVHDTVNEIDGVATISEGEDPRRRVVILPAPDAAGPDEA